MDEERILTNGSTVELSWHVAKNADEYYVYGFPRKCDGDVRCTILGICEIGCLIIRKLDTRISQITSLHA